MKNRIITVIVSTILFILGSWLFYKYLLDSGFGFFNLVINGKSSEFISTRSGEIVAGDKIFGRFTTDFPNLGIVSVRFDNRYRDSDDTLAFRIKESGRDDWYYVANYNTDQFLPGKLFPFGFPIITGSGGKTYLFEIESLRGATGSGIFVDVKPPIFTAVSFFNKAEIVNSIPKISNFLIKKTINVIGDKENFTMAVIYFSPFVFYIVYLLLSGVSYQALMGFTFANVMWEIYYLQSVSNFLFLSTLFLWSLTVYRHRFQSRISAAISLVFLVISILCLIFDKNIIAEKFSTWAYLFLCATAIQQIYELNFKSVNNFTLSKVIKNIYIVKFDRTNASSLFLRKAVPPFLLLICMRLLAQSYAKIRQSIGLFKDFYPNLNSIPNLSSYVFVVALIVFIAIVVIILKRSTLKHNPALFLVFVLVFKIFIFSVSDRFTVFQHTPKILSVSPSTTSEAWVDVTIQGKNFQNMPFVGKVLLGKTEQVGNIIFWSDEKIIFRTNPVLSTSGDICVQTMSKGNSNCLPFRYNFGKNKLK